MTRTETEEIINRLKQNQSGLVEELIPNILTMGEVQKVLQELLREKVWIRNIGLILEVLVDNGARNKDPDALTELVRQQLGSAICQALTSQEGDLYVLTLDPTIEQTIAGSIRSLDDKGSLILEPKFTEQLLKKLSGEVERMLNNNMLPVLLCAPTLRRHVRRLTERIVPHLAVLSLSEVPNNCNLRSFGMVNV